MTITENQARLRSLEEQIKAARVQGALFHPTNPADAWFCGECGCFGRGGKACWACDNEHLSWQYVPRFGGGAQTVIIDWEQESSLEGPAPGLGYDSINRMWYHVDAPTIE